jgi:hypothetical protein
MEVILAQIVETHGLSSTEAAWLRRIAAGAVPGNRDRPLFILASAILRSGCKDLVLLVLPGNATLSREKTALLDLIFTVSLEDTVQAARLLGSLSAAQQAPDPLRALTADFVNILGISRRRIWPEAQHHNVFVAARRFLKRHRPADPFPRDGDAPPFWAAEGTRELLTRYTTALRALADYAQAARLAATWREVRSLDDETFGDVSTEDAVLIGQDDPLDRTRLEGALAVLSEGRVKLLLAHERESLKTLAGYADLVRVWPCDTFAALALGPVQNMVIQAVRRGAAIPSIEVYIGKAKGFPDIRDHHAELDEAVMAILHVMAKSKDVPRETGPARSKDQVTLNKRIAAMERRQTFAELSEDARHRLLNRLIDSVLDLKAMIDAYLGAWKKLDPNRAAEADAAHRRLFQQKLDGLYNMPVERPAR